jgi:hypothetical protein
MKKIATFLISAILTMNYVNIYAQTVTNPTEGCSFRFVLVNPNAMGWFPDVGIKITANGIDYGFINLPWGTPVGEEKEEIILLPSGEVHFLWIGSFNALLNYFEIYNSLDELIYTSPESLSGELFFTYQNECNIGTASTTLRNQISVYPNPANNELRITNYELRITAVEIFDFLGRRQCLNFVQQPKAEDTMVINISNIPNGIYFVMITTEKGRVTKKVIKQQI